MYLDWVNRHFWCPPLLRRGKRPPELTTEELRALVAQIERDWDAFMAVDEVAREMMHREGMRLDRKFMEEPVHAEQA